MSGAIERSRRPGATVRLPPRVGYSEWLNGYSTQVSGAIYLLQPYRVDTLASCVTKLSADGNTMLWYNHLSSP